MPGKPKTFIFLLLSMLLFIITGYVQSNDGNAQDKLEGKWEGKICLGMPATGISMKYASVELSLRFSQTGESFNATGMFASQMPVNFSGAVDGTMFYGTNMDAVLSGVSIEKTFFVFRGFLNGDSMQVTIDQYQHKDNLNTWIVGGIATLQKKGD